MITGTIARIVDHGTIVQVWVKAGKCTEVSVNFDHRQFRHLLEAEACDLIGRTVAYHHHELDEPTIEFLD